MSFWICSQPSGKNGKRKERKIEQTTKVEPKAGSSEKREVDDMAVDEEEGEAEFLSYMYDANHV